MAAVGLAFGAEAPTGGRWSGKGRLAWLPVFLLWLALLVEGAIFALAQPPWSPVDEAQHFHYVESLAEARKLPVMGESFISPAVVGIARETGRWGWQPQRAAWPPADSDPAGWTGLPAELEGAEKEQWLRQHLWRFSYEAMQPPLYYALNAPFYSLLPEPVLAKVYGLRLLAVLLASAMVPLAWLTAREAWPGSRLAVYGTPAVVLLAQGYVLNLSQVTNDALAAPLAAAALLMLLRLIARGLTPGRCLAAGLLIAASLLVKMTTAFLLPAALVAFGVLAVRAREPLRRHLGQAVMLFVPASLLLAPWLARNFAVYGDATGAAAAAALLGPVFTFDTLSLQSLRLDELLPTFWFGEPYGALAWWRYTWAAVPVALLLAGAGFGRCLAGRWRELPGPVRLRAGYLLLAVLAGAVTILLLPLASGICGTPGRYFYPLLPAIAFLILFGIERLLGERLAGVVAVTLAAWMAFWEIFNLTAYLGAG